MVETYIRIPFVCIAAPPPVVALPPRRVVVLHVLSASRFLTNMTTQLPLFYAFVGQAFLIPFAHYSVTTLCFSVRTMPPQVLSKRTLSTSPVAHLRECFWAHPFIASAKQRLVLIPCWMPLLPMLHQHRMCTPSHPPTPITRATHARFLPQSSKVIPSLLCIACGRTLDGRLILGEMDTMHNERFLFHSTDSSCFFWSFFVFRVCGGRDIQYDSVAISFFFCFSNDDDTEVHSRIDCLGELFRRQSSA